MKKLFLALAFLLALPLAQAQQYASRVDVTTAVPSTSVTVNLYLSGAAYHLLTWTKSGTVTACSVRVDSSADGSTWNVGDIVAAQTCTSNGTAVITNGVFNYARINVVTKTGSGTVTPIYYAFLSDPTHVFPFPRLDQVLDPTADKAFSMTSHLLEFDFSGTAGSSPIQVIGTNVGGAEAVVLFGSSTDTNAKGLSVISETNGAASNLQSTALFVAAGNTSAGNTHDLTGVFIKKPYNTGGTISSIDGLFVDDQGGATSTAAISIAAQNGTGNSSAGLAVGDVTGATTNYAVKTGLGLVSLGDAMDLGPIHYANRGAVVKGRVFYCDDCDPSTVSGVANECTSAGTKTGAIAMGTGTKWACLTVN